jgi:hypothetical protein
MSHYVISLNPTTILHYPLLSHYDTLGLAELADRARIQVQMRSYQFWRRQGKPSVPLVSRYSVTSRHGLTVAETDPDNDHS